MLFPLASRPRQRLAIAAALVALPMLAAPSPLAAEHVPEAVSLAHRTMAAMGGEDKWEGTRLLRFDFTSLREGKPGALYQHWWDRHTGAYRLEGVDNEGVGYRVLFDLDDRTGRAWKGGRELEGEQRARLLEMAYARFINDTYWLLMPWKWLDPGVRLGHEGRKTVDGKEYEVVTLAFGDGVGLTSNDRYWGYVEPGTGRMERWAYLLQDREGAPGQGEPTAWTWEEWKPTAAGIELSTVRRRLGGPDVQIRFPVAEAWAAPTDEQLREAFEPPAPAPGASRP
jgi:hypothetical protein